MTNQDEKMNEELLGKIPNKALGDILKRARQQGELNIIAKVKDMVWIDYKDCYRVERDKFKELKARFKELKNSEANGK